MALLTYSRQRVRAFLDEIDDLSNADFAYGDSEAALEHVRARFKRHLNKLDFLDPAASNAETVARACQIVLNDLTTYLPIVGIIFRSTTVRNAFEAFGPFLRLAGDVLEPHTEPGQRSTKLLLSSEWDFTTSVVHAVTDLPDFVFIGLPAPESGNPLLIPLAGHELGHTVWFRKKLREVLYQRAKAEVIAAITADWDTYLNAFPGVATSPADVERKKIAVETYSPALDWCLNQAEETFCDFMGVRIFGASYLHAFGYLLSPGFGSRSTRYPESLTRARNMLRAAAAFEIVPPSDFNSLFIADQPLQGHLAETFQWTLADRALEPLIPVLIAEVALTAKNASLATSTVKETERVFQRLKRLVPAENCKSIADILNAAWAAYGADDLWIEHPVLHDKRTTVLKELILKNLEIFEIERIQAE